MGGSAETATCFKSEFPVRPGEWKIAETAAETGFNSPTRLSSAVLVPIAVEWVSEEVQ